MAENNAFSPQITQIRLANGVTVAFVDWTDQPLFSTIEIQNGSSVQEMDFFQYTVGDAVPAFSPVAVAGQRSATELDTNMSQPGAMASTEEMLVFALRPEVFARAVSDANAPNFAAPVALASPLPMPAALMYEVLNLRTTLLLEISQKIYSEAGFGYFNFGGGVSSAGDAAGAAPASTNGLPSQEAVRSLVVPQHIGGQEKFRAFLRFADDGTGDGIELGLNEDGVSAARYARIRLYLDGLHKRPVA